MIAFILSLVWCVSCFALWIVGPIEIIQNIQSEFVIWYYEQVSQAWAQSAGYSLEEWSKIAIKAVEMVAENLSPCEVSLKQDIILTKDISNLSLFREPYLVTLNLKTIAINGHYFSDYDQLINLNLSTNEFKNVINNLDITKEDQLLILIEFLQTELEFTDYQVEEYCKAIYRGEIKISDIF